MKKRNTSNKLKHSPHKRKRTGRMTEHKYQIAWFRLKQEELKAKKLAAKETS